MDDSGWYVVGDWCLLVLGVLLRYAVAVCRRYPLKFVSPLVKLSFNCGDDSCRADADVGRRDVAGLADTLDGRVGGSEATEEVDVCRCSRNDVCSASGFDELQVLLRRRSLMSLPPLLPPRTLSPDTRLLRLGFETVESARRTLRHTDGEYGGDGGETSPRLLSLAVELSVCRIAAWRNPRPSSLINDCARRS